MKLTWAYLITGLVLLYFIDSAMDIGNIDVEMVLHNLYHFGSGFLVLGIWSWYRDKTRVKLFIYVVIALLLVDEVMDYLRGIDNMSVEMLIHDIFVASWGALVGLSFIKDFKEKYFGELKGS